MSQAAIDLALRQGNGGALPPKRTRARKPATRPARKAVASAASVRDELVAIGRILEEAATLTPAGWAYLRARLGGAVDA